MGKRTSHVKVAGALLDVTDLLVLVHVLAEEALELGLVQLAEAGLGDVDHVAVLVGALGSTGLSAGLHGAGTLRT